MHLSQKDSDDSNVNDDIKGLSSNNTWEQLYGRVYFVLLRETFFFKKKKQNFLNIEALSVQFGSW